MCMPSFMVGIIWFGHVCICKHALLCFVVVYVMSKCVVYLLCVYAIVLVLVVE